MPDLPETNDPTSELPPQLRAASTAPAENELIHQIGTPVSLIYQYTSDSNAAEAWELPLSFNETFFGEGQTFPPFPIIQFYNAAGEHELLSETALKITKIEFIPTELLIKPVVIHFETHAVAPLKKGETLLIRMVG